MHYLNTRDLPGEALVLNLIYLLYNPRDFKYRVWHPTTILLSRSCHWMDHCECGRTWKLVCQSALYSLFKVSKLDFSAKNLSLFVKDVLQMILWTEILFAAIWRISVHKKCWLIMYIVIMLLSSYLYRDKRSCPWQLVVYRLGLF